MLQFLFTLPLFAMSMYQGSPGTDTQFQITRPDLTLEPARQAILLNDDGAPLVFRLTMAQSVPAEARIQAELIGPGLASPVAVDQPATQPAIVLARSHFGQEGIFELTNVRLVLNGQVLSFAAPRNAEIQVSQEFVVTEVTVDPLSEQDLLALGYVFHPDDYVAVNFQLALSIETKPERVDVSIPVVFPRHENSAFRPQVLRDPFSTFQISPIIIPSPDGPNPVGDPVFPPAQVAGKRAPLMGLLLIPGQLKYLKSHFAVTCVLMNASPEGFDVRATDLVAELRLPDAQQAGFPLSIQEPTRQVMINLGADGVEDTADDNTWVNPGEQARAKYVLTGNVPGLHDFEVSIRGTLHLPQGQEPFSTLTQASVYVRSPDYAVSFEHPDAVEADEAYDLIIRVRNTGQVALDQFQLVLDGDRLQGVRLANGQHPVQDFGTIAPGEEQLATYRLRSQVTGKVVAGYVKLNGINQGSEAIGLRVAVGDIGQRISPYTLHFAQAFYDYFPSDLTDALKRFAKKALDVSMTADHELPADLMPTASNTVREMNRAFVHAAKGRDFGMSEAESLLQLWRAWVHFRDGYEPLDRIRRKVLAQEELPLEQAFANAFASRLDADPQTLLTQIAQEHEEFEHLSVFVVDHSGPIQLTTQTATGSMTSAGARDLPFASMLPLSATRTLVWVSGAAQRPQLLIEPTSNTPISIHITGLSDSIEDNQRWSFQTNPLAITSELSLSFDDDTDLAQLSQPGEPRQTVVGQPVPIKPFRLVDIAQVHRTRLGNADHLGRHHRLYFSKPVDLSSLYPLEDHLTIQGEPIAFGELQADKRTLIVTSRMPLGPYHPIAYRLQNVRSHDDRVIALDEGQYTGSASYRGVSVAGRVADRRGTDLTRARAFLWLLDHVLDPDDPAFTGRKRMVPRIVQTVHPDAEGRWVFDFVPTITEPESADPFLFQTLRVGVVLEDGRYQEQIFRPKGAGQVIAAEFAFMELGSVHGHITSAGEPVPFTQVFVRSENNPLSAEIVETDANGYYRADNLEVGQILVKASFQNAIGLTGGYLTAYNTPMTIDLDIATPVANLSGTVTRSIAGVIEPLAGVTVGYVAQGRTFNQIYFDQHNVGAKFVALTQTDALGRYSLSDLPAGQGEVWFYHFDHGLVRRPMILLEHESGVADYQFQFESPATAQVSGYVENTSGQRIAGARISYGTTQTTTDATGYFELGFLPKEQDISIRASHPDWGRGILGLYLEQDQLDNQTIVLYGSVPISGTYLDKNGDPVPFAPVYMSYLIEYSISGYPYYSDFTYFAQTDFAGRWHGRGPKESVYRFSGFSPPESVYTGNITVGPQGMENVLLQKSGLADLRVRLVDDNGQPVVAKVDLKSMVPSVALENLGQPELVTTHQNVFTDVDGYATFTGLSTGTFEVFGHSGDHGETDVHAGTLTETVPGEPHLVTLAFPPPEEPANLFGNIYLPDGETPAPDGTIVRLRGPGINAYVLSTLAGTYRFENLDLGTDPVRLELIVYNAETQHFYRHWLDLNQDLNFRHDLILRKRMTVEVSVVDSAGQPVEYAEVHADFLDIGHDPTLVSKDGLTGESIQAGYARQTGQVTPEEPIWAVPDVPSGPMVLRAISGNGLSGLKRVTLPLDRDTLAVTVRLETASQIRGVFVDDDEVPLLTAPVALKQGADVLHQILSGDAPGEEGTFLFDQLPMGRYDLEGIDPATARRAHLSVTTSPFRPSPDVVLQLDPVTSLTGVATFNGEPVPNTTLVLRGRHFKVTTGTDALGRYHFANVPLGKYNVKGSAHAIASRIYDEISLVEPNTTHVHDLVFGSTRDLHVTLLQADGSPLPNVLLDIYRGSNVAYFPLATSAYTDQHGVAILRHLPAGNYRLLTDRLDHTEAVYEKITLHEAEPSPATRQIQLPGTGFIQGIVTDNLGQPLDRPVQVRIAIQDVFARYKHVTITTDPTGFYRLGNVLVDQRIELEVFHPVTREADRAVVRLSADGETLEQNFQFRATTHLAGQVLLPDGSPAAYAKVWTESPLRNETRADAAGYFTLTPVMAGETTLFAQEPASQRENQFALSITSSDGETLDPMDDMTITLNGVAELTGVIGFDAGDPVRFGSVRLHAVDGTNSFETRIQGDGTYRFVQIPLGDYNLVAYADQYGVESEPYLVGLNSDQASVVADHLLPESYILSGTLFAPNRIDPVVAGTVSLWRPRSAYASQDYERVYETTTDAQGRFHFERVFPGPYLLRAENGDLSAALADGLFAMPNADMEQPIYLETILSLTGILADGSDRPFTKGSLVLHQDGESTRLNLDPQGGFAKPRIRPTPYRLDYKLAGGWITGSLSVNQPSAEPVSLQTVDTVTLSGRAILAKDGTPRNPAVYLVKGGIARRVAVAADGHWSMARVPANEPISLKLTYGSAHRTIELGSFTTDSQLGDYYLDAIKPDISFPAQGVSITALPVDMEFQLAESDPQSDIDPLRTVVWANGKNISEWFTSDQTTASAHFTLLPPSFVLGENTIKVRVYNSSGVYRESSFTVVVTLTGPTLVVQCQLGDDVSGIEFRKDDQPWQSLADDGRLLIHNITEDQLRLKARALGYGKRQLVTLTDQVTQYVTLDLHPVGSYRGRVIDVDGSPAQNRRIQLGEGDDYEITDSAGQFDFDLLPWGTHDLIIDDNDRFGFLEGPDILNHEQVFLNVDLALDGYGFVEGHLYDGDGTTPIAGSRISLSYTDLPRQFTGMSTVTDTNGYYRFERVLTRALQVSARETDSPRSARIQTELQLPDDTVVVDLSLQSASTLTGIVLGVDGQPAPQTQVVLRRYLGSDEPSIETLTDENGIFTIEALPRSLYQAYFTRDSHAEYRNSIWVEVNADTIDRGTIQLLLDQPPYDLGLVTADPYHPGTHKYITLEALDDRKLARWELQLTGAFEATFTGTTGSKRLHHHIHPRIPTATPAGTMHYQLEVWDHLDQSHMTTGSIALMPDTFGPNLTWLTPTENATFFEGQSIPIDVRVTDPSGMSSISARLNDTVVGQESGYFDADETFSFTAMAPSVDEITTVTLTIVATDRKGNTQSHDRQVSIAPILTTGAPEVTVLSPIHDEALPLWLPQGLQLQFAADAHDPDGLGSYDIRVNGVVAVTGILSGTDARLERTFDVPPEWRSSQSLTISWSVRDLGGNAFTAESTVLTMDETATVRTDANPLDWPHWYQVPPEDRRLILVGGEHIVDGDHNLDSLVLVNGAILTQTASVDGDAFVAGTRLFVSDNVLIDWGSRIDVNGKGYQHLPLSLNLGNGKASHGGLAEGTVNLDQLYGSPFQPIHPGSHRGGGAIAVHTNRLSLVGNITANAASTTSKPGSGGSVWVSANEVTGLGWLTANGFSGEYAASPEEGGGGGRIAIEAPGSVQAQAYGGQNAGAGTIYRRRPDLAQADGYHDSLAILNHPQATSTNQTAIRTRWDLVVGTDITIETAIVDNETRHVLQFLDPSPLPPGSFLGMRVYREGEYDTSSPIQFQTATSLQSGHNQTFGSFQTGDQVSVGYSVDQLEVGQFGWMLLDHNQPAQTLKLPNGRLTSTVASIELGDFTVESGNWVDLRGQFATGSVTVNGTLILDGRLAATTLTVPAEGTVTTPEDQYNGAMQLSLAQGYVDGQILARGNGLPLSASDGLRRSHGGLGTGSGSLATYGSLYHPDTNGNSDDGFAGGSIVMDFDSLDLNGIIDVTPRHSGSGGSIRLEGTSFLGSGQLIARGGPSRFDTGGGGRIAVLVDQIDGFSGTTSVRGSDAYNSNYIRGGAGTVYYRTLQWPNGRLVIDNDGLDAPQHSTPLPGIGPRTLSTATDGSRLDDSGLPPFGSLIGLYVTADGHDPVRVANQDDQGLIPAGAFPALEAGANYGGLHRLDILEVRGGAKVLAIDPIEIAQQYLTEDAEIDAEIILPVDETLADGSSVLNSDPGWTSLVLDNYQLTVEFPLNVERLTLRNNSSLTYRQPVQAGIVEVLTGSTLIAAVDSDTPGFHANTLTMRDGSTWAVANRMSGGRAFPLRATVTGLCTIEPGATVTTSGNSKVPHTDPIWAGVGYATYAHGGLPRFHQAESRTRPAGSFADPNWPGNYHGGGVIRIQAGQMLMDGLIKANGRLSGAGGSIRLEATQFSGSGHLSTVPEGGGAGGGRIAIHYGTDSAFTQTMTFSTLPDWGTTQAPSAIGAGTIFLKGSEQTYGDLIVDQQNVVDNKLFDMSERFLLTAVTGSTPVTLSLDDADASPYILRDNSWTLLPPGLEGLAVICEIDGTTYRSNITANTHNQLTVDQPLPDIVPAGTEIRFVLPLNNLTLRNGAQFHFDGVIELHGNLLLEGNHLLSLSAHDLQGLPNPWSLTDQHFRLNLVEPTLANHDLILQNTTLYMDRPIEVRDISLVESWLEHSKWTGDAYETKLPYLNVTARNVVADANSGMDVSRRVKHRGSENGYGSPRPAGGSTYGSLFQPADFGSGTWESAGGRLKLTAQTIDGGRFLAQGEYIRTGGSVWIDGQVLRGNIEADAGLSDRVSGAGGRVAIYYRDDSQATIAAQAYGVGAGGTIYLKDHDESLGHLQILSETIPDLGDHHTTIPSFPIQTLPANLIANFDAATNTTTLWVPGLITDTQWAEYHLIHNDNQVQPWHIVNSESESDGTRFTLAGDASGFQPGDQLQLAVIVDRFTLSAGTIVDLNDLLLLSNNAYPADHVFTSGDGTFLEPPQVANNRLVLDQFNMILHTPAHYDHVELRNGSSLIIKVPGSQDTPVLTGQSLTVTDGLVAADHLNFAGDVIVATNGRIEAYTTWNDVFQWPAGTDYEDSSKAGLSYGGLGTIQAGDLAANSNQTYGSFREPWTVGSGRRALRLSAGTLLVDGVVSPDWNRDRNLGEFGGGALWIETGSFAGSGRLHVNVHTFETNQYAGGGRIALYYDDMSAWQGSIEAFSNNGGSSPTYVDRYQRRGGSGTIYLKRNNQTFGDLVITGQNASTIEGSTPLVGLGRRVLSAQVSVNGSVLSDPGQTFPYSLAGLYLAVDVNGSLFESRIVSNTVHSITVADPLPGLLPGEEIEARLHLDNLRLEQGAQFYSPDHVIVHDQINFGSRSEQKSTLWARALSVPNTIWTISQQAGGLALEEPLNIERLVLDDSDFNIDLELQVDQVDVLNGSVVSHRTARDASYRRYPVKPAVSISANNIFIDATSAIDVSDAGFPNHSSITVEDMWFVEGDVGLGHGGNAFDMGNGYAYGSPFEPNSYGFKGGAGRVHLRTDILTLEGSLSASDNIGGSIWIEAGNISGDGLIQANGGVGGSPSGSGGRIAIYSDTNTLTQAPQAFSPVVNHNGSAVQYGAGTVYLYNQTETQGTLIVRNAGLAADSVLPSPIVGIGNHNLTASPNNPSVIHIPDAGWRFSLAGHRLIDSGNNTIYRVITNTTDTLTLDRPVSPAPTAGWAFHGEPPIDSLEKEYAAVLSMDPIVDREPPTLTDLVIEPLSNGRLVGGLPFQVTFNADDNIGLVSAAVSFNGSSTVLNDPPWTAGFAAPTPNQATLFTLSITLQDQAGLETTVNHDIWVESSDQTGPSITVLQPAIGQSLGAGAPFELRLQVSDDDLVDSVSASFNGNQQNQTITTEQQDDPVVFTFTTPFSATDQTLPIAISATDRSGNVTDITHTITIEVVAALATMPKPMLYLTMDESDRSDHYSYDLTRRHVGIMHGLVPGQPGQIGEAYKFGGLKHLEVPHSEDLDLSGGGISLSAWIYPTSFSSSHARIFERLTTDESTWRFILKLDSTNGKPRFYVKDDQGSYSSVSSPTSVALNTWTHIAAVSDGQKLLLYINGSLVKQSTFTTTVGTSTAPLILGGNPKSNDKFFIGSMDEMGVWDQALTAESVALLYQFGLNSVTPDFQPPEEVTNVVVSTTANQATLTWSASPNAAGDLSELRIYRDDVLVESSLDPVTASWTGSGLSPHSSQTWRISAVDLLNNESRGVRLNSTTRDAYGRRLAITPPVAAWPLDLAWLSGNQVWDLFGTVDGTLNGGMTGASGKVGEAIRFSATDDAVVMTSDPIVDDLQEGDFTLAAWYRPDAIPPHTNSANKHHAILMKQGQNVGLYYTREQHFRVAYQLSSGGIYLSSLHAYPPGIWHHVAATVNKQDGVIRLYVDGHLHREETFSSSTSVYNFGTKPWRLGEAGPINHTTRYPAVGSIDEPKVWNEALDADQISTLFQEENAGITMDFQAPADPEFQAISATSDSITLSWTAPSDPSRVGYRLWVDDAITPIEISPSATETTVTGLTSGSLIDVRLSAFDLQNDESDGVWATVRTLSADNTLPAVPMPVSRWTLDTSEIDGTTVNDSVGGHHGQLNGSPTMVGAVNGEGLSLVNDDDAVLIPNHADLENIQEQNYSLSIWFKPEHLPSDSSDYYRHFGLLMKHGTNMGLYYTREGTFRMAHRLFGEGIWISSRPVEPGRFYHVAAVVNRDIGLVRLYVNGLLEAEQSFSSSTQVHEFYANPWRLGEAASSSHSLRWPAKGVLDDAFIWNQALQADHIAVLHQTVRGGTDPQFLQSTKTNIPVNKPKLVRNLDRVTIDQADGSLVIRDQTIIVEDYQSDRPLTLIRSHLLVRGSLRAPALRLTDHSEISASRSTEFGLVPLQISIEDALVVDSTSRISANGVGGGRVDRTSHGGLGTGDLLDDLYDSPIYPAMMGDGPAGGGVIWIEATSVDLSGRLEAKGRGRSAGGSIQIHTIQLFGNGEVDVSGGTHETVIGGGGRIAVHAEQWTGFSGQMTTGEEIKHRGTIVLGHPEQSGVSLFDQFPADRTHTMTHPILPAHEIPIEEIETVRIDEQTTGLILTNSDDLSALRGLWIALEGDVYFIDEVLKISKERTLIQILGHPNLPSRGSLPVLLLINNVNEIEPVQGGLWWQPPQ